MKTLVFAYGPRVGRPAAVARLDGRVAETVMSSSQCTHISKCVSRTRSLEVSMRLGYFIFIQFNILQ